MFKRKYYYFKVFLIVFLLFSTACTSIGEITERPCSKNITVIKDEVANKNYAISETVIIIDNDESHHWSLTMFFQESQNKYWLALMHYSYGGVSKELEYLNLKLVDGSEIELANPTCDKEMNDGPNNRYTNSFFEINKSDIINLVEKNITELKASLRNSVIEPMLETKLDTEKASTIKYLAKCFNEIVSKY